MSCMKQMVVQIWSTSPTLAYGVWSFFVFPMPHYLHSFIFSLVLCFWHNRFFTYSCTCYNFSCFSFCDFFKPDCPSIPYWILGNLPISLKPVHGAFELHFPESYVSVDIQYHLPNYQQEWRAEILCRWQGNLLYKWDTW